MNRELDCADDITCTGLCLFDWGPLQPLYYFTSTTTMSLSFKGQTVVITGAGGGLGKAYVLYARAT